MFWMTILKRTWAWELCFLPLHLCWIYKSATDVNKFYILYHQYLYLTCTIYWASITICLVSDLFIFTIFYRIVRIKAKIHPMLIYVLCHQDKHFSTVIGTANIHFNKFRQNGEWTKYVYACDASQTLMQILTRTNVRVLIVDFNFPSMLREVKVYIGFWVQISKFQKWTKMASILIIRILTNSYKPRIIWVWQFWNAWIC